MKYDKLRLKESIVEIKGVVSLEGEIWKCVVGYEGAYAVSNFGRFKRVGSVKKYHKNGINRTKRHRERLMGVRVSLKGYIICGIVDKNAKLHTATIHRLVAQAFIPNPQNKPEVNHIDSDRSNNHISNLEWVTSKENHHHARIYGNKGYDIGETANAAILKEKHIPEIRRKYTPYKYSMKMLADEYGVSLGAIYSILSRRTWKHI